MYRIVFLILIAVVAGTIAPAGTSRAETFRDWRTTCSPDGGCEASTGIAPRLVVERASVESSGWFIAIEFPDHPSRPDRAIVLTIAGSTKVILKSDGGFRAYRSPRRIYVTDRAALETLLPAMLAGDELRIDYFDVTNDSRSAELSLSGLTASMLWIEEQMHIAGRPRAAVPPFGLSAADPPETDPVRDAGIPDIVLAYHQRTSDCEIYDDTRLRDLGSHIEPLNPTSILYALPCTAHAYNVTYRLYLREIGEIGGIRTLYFSDYSTDTAWSGTDLLFNITVEGDRLTAFYKARGLGDCGTLGEWQWNQYDYRLVRYAIESECRGVQPDRWPIVFPSG